MSCAGYRKMLVLYDELDAAEMQNLNTHLASCVSCRAVHAQTRRQKLVLTMVTPARQTAIINPVLTARIMSAIGEAAQPRFLQRVYEYLGYSPVRYAFAIVSFLLVVFFVTETRRVQVTDVAADPRHASDDSKTVTLNSSEFYQVAKQRFDSKDLFKERPVLSLYACARACKAGESDACNECKMKYSKN
jgi:hypothetical protein